MTAFTITPMLDDEDNSPVYEVTSTDGYATNAVTLDDALDIVRDRIRPALSLEAVAEEWIVAHGTNTYDNMGEEISEEFYTNFTDDQLDTILSMIASAEVVVRFHA